MDKDFSKTRSTYPHSPDVMERETSDDGFSKGWGMHFIPVSKYYLDVHGHIGFADFNHADTAVQTYLKKTKPLGIKRITACSPIMTLKEYKNEPQGFKVGCITEKEELEPYFSLAKRNQKLSIMLFLNFRNPNPEIVRWSFKKGACAVKLHNAPLIVNAADPYNWLGDQWSSVFDEIQKAGLPVLWHVTQRLSGNPYTNGGINTYWKEGWGKGVSYNNETLLQIYLKIVERYPDIPFISAHQLHLGWERLDKLMRRYPNLYIDTSIGCYIRDGDRLYDEDRDYIRKFFIDHSDRILFGSDYSLTDKIGDVTMEDGHIRFIRQLRLPYDELQRISHANAEKLLKLTSIEQ